MQRVTLREWADHIRKWRRQDRSVFAFFDNDQKSAAPADARRLMALLGVEKEDRTGDATSQRLGDVGKTLRLHHDLDAAVLLVPELLVKGR